MTGFNRIQGALTCDGVPLADIAASTGTPVYVYSAGTIISRYRAVDDAFASYPHAMHYALKANSTLAIARLIRGLGAGADANSGGEIDVALRAGFIPSQIVFTGVGKTDAELAQAIDLGVKSINAESEGELARIDALARARQTRAKVALRINPDIDARSHPHISTGNKNNKFGIQITEVRELCRRMHGRDGVEIIGLHIHIGSQITNLDPLRRAAQALVDLAQTLKDDGTVIEHLDLGGGLGISYEGQHVPSATDYAAAILPVIKPSGLLLILEPGRNIVGPAGVLVSSVLDIKPQSNAKDFVIIDAGMTELIRPMLYDAFHGIQPVIATGAPEIACDVVGPLCETSDTVGKERRLPQPRVGDLVAIMDTGAYGSVMASNYNRRVFAPEVLVQDGQWSIIRRRQTVDDLLALEV